MTEQEFRNTINDDFPARDLSIPMQALWWNKKGDWKKAHDLIDHLEDNISAHIHAYLHRVEGDQWNARYWYNRANQLEYKGSLAEEWDYLVQLYS